MRHCRKCAEKGDKILMKVIRETFTMRVFKCPKCGNVRITNRN